MPVLGVHLRPSARPSSPVCPRLRVRGVQQRLRDQTLRGLAPRQPVLRSIRRGFTQPQRRQLTLRPTPQRLHRQHCFTLV